MIDYKAINFIISKTQSHKSDYMKIIAVMTK